MPKAYALTDPSAPKFPSKFDILKKAVLQKTDLTDEETVHEVRRSLDLGEPFDGEAAAPTEAAFRC